ncbi:MAG: hypothetical protein IKL36_02670, partial [Clostridia bacterium]|nr:hypothetical protein [Clostridia bacterium]
MKISYEDLALTYIPQPLADRIKKTMALYKGNVSEIRLRVNAPVYITVSNNNISCNISATPSEIQTTVRSLCGNSMYTHSDTITEGYICTSSGIRAGVCGRAVIDNRRIISVADISSVCIRIPHRVKGAANELIPLLLEGIKGILFYSKPGVGKTTVLRELTASLASPPFNSRIAVIDTRYEICGALTENHSIDVLYGYPRSKGIEIALRTMSPEYIVCDEIGNTEDADAIFCSCGAGVPVIATVHAGSINELKEKLFMKELINNKVFDWL